jgi:hypothetical protein
LILIDFIGMLMGLVLPAFAGGVRVTVENTGRQPLRAVRLHVTGASYNLGDIAVGGTAGTVVRATSESHLEIEFTDTSGRKNRLNAGGYFEPGYRGTIQVSIKEGAIDKNEQDVR